MSLLKNIKGDSIFTLITRGLQIVLVALIGYGVLRGTASLAVNGMLALTLTLVPTVLGWRFDYEVDPRLVIWITVAALFHVVGFIGLYNIQSGLLSWYDQVAHAISASFVAGAGYAVIVALDHSSARVHFPEEFRFIFTLCFILAFGVAWEIAEFTVGGLASMLGSKAVLTQYGTDDIVSDLVFNTIAAIFIAIWGTTYFRSITAIVSRRFFRTGKP
ncbi:hypothetical protein [Haladaptatus sp. DYF46]|uniref:hypothetical protein n=1 Tax=Haladaptatus sp. DYF46 TaxID=2886041 RepID=UPI001E2B8346|nr:hypothetical protein [Haladaptatus sp. DYF46]